MWCHFCHVNWLLMSLYSKNILCQTTVSILLVISTHRVLVFRYSTEMLKLYIMWIVLKAVVIMFVKVMSFLSYGLLTNLTFRRHILPKVQYPLIGQFDLRKCELRTAIELLMALCLQLGCKSIITMPVRMMSFFSSGYKLTSLSKDILCLNFSISSIWQFLLK